MLGGIATGTANITYTLNTGCIRVAVATVSSAPPAIITPIGDTIMCPGDFVTLTSSTSPGVTYEWYNAGILIPGAVSPTYIANATGSYQVQVNVAVGCSSLSSPMSVTVNSATATITVPGGSTTTCSGTPIVLDANTGPGLNYQWELGGAPLSTATTSTYNALTGGNYTVRVTNATGCFAVSAPTTIIVNPSPVNVVSASGPLTICDGSNVVLTAASGPGYGYQWYDALGSIAGATGISYTASTPGSYHVVVTGVGACTSTSATSVVVVNPLPNVAITPGGTLVFCGGGNVVLDAAGFTYQWYKNGTIISGATNQAYTASTSGGYRVEVTDGTTGCFDMTHADTVVSVVTSPTAIPLTPAKFCWGGSALLSTSVSGLGSAIVYQWFFNGVPIPGAIGSTYSASASGDYSCKITVPASCTITSSTVAVNEVPLPDPPITFDGMVFHTAGFYITYQWYKNLVLIPGATSSATPATSDGNYKVAVTDTNGCQSVSSVYVLNGWKGGTPSGVINANSTEIRIYPNPAMKNVNIESAQQVRAIISGVDGRMLVNVPMAKSIDISNLADGMYIISVYDNSNYLLKTQKLVKRAE